jgi:hypothetical protein
VWPSSTRWPTASSIARLSSMWTVLNSCCGLEKAPMITTGIREEILDRASSESFGPTAMMASQLFEASILSDFSRGWEGVVAPMISS